MAAVSALNYHWCSMIVPELRDNHHLFVFLSSHGTLAVAVFFLLVIN
jgi:hypothetical protein